MTEYKLYQPASGTGHGNFIVSCTTETGQRLYLEADDAQNGYRDVPGVMGFTLTTKEDVGGRRLETSIRIGLEANCLMNLKKAIEIVLFRESQKDEGK